jgi:hypothetical protein
MFRNLFLISVLAAALATILYFKPWITEDSLPPRVFDRLPEADIIGQSDILDLSRSLSKTMFYYRIPFRDFITPEFLLSQGKNYGLNFQEPVYFFANEKDNKLKDWGAIVHLRDSSKVQAGIVYLKKFANVTEIDFLDTKVYQIEASEISLVYGDDWIFVYQGKNFKKRIEGVLKAKRNEISPKWRIFFNKRTPENRPVYAQLHLEQLRELGIESTEISMTNDSTHFYFHTVITQFDSLSFQLKNSGKAYEKKAFTKNIINLHFDVNRLKNSENDPISIILNKLGRKINFPTTLFLNTWDGDLSYRQGGFQTIKEQYITSELDENFEVTDVVSYKDVKIAGFDLFLSMKENKNSFLNSLFSKGLITESDNKYRFLYSSPFHIKKNSDGFVFHTSNYTPKLKSDSISSITWNFNYTPIEFFIDSTKTKTVFGRIQVPLQKLISDYIPAN